MTGKEQRLTVLKEVGESDAGAIARTYNRPEIRAAVAIATWQDDKSEIDDVARELSKQIEKVNGGDMGRPEAMLLAQAHTLDELFNNLARQARSRDSLHVMESLLRLAFKAQTQCRATLETLSNIKNPPIVYAKQANFANGHQQINNGTPAMHGEETKNKQSELLGVNDGERLDTGTTSKTGTEDKAMATLD